MKKMGNLLLKNEVFSEIVMGNTALVRAMIETNTRVVSSYPGSPTPEIATAIKSIPKGDRPFYFEFSVNEKIATEIAYGAAVNGYLSSVFFKSVGLNVAADTFVQLGMMNIIGGMIIILGDDPGANSSQNEQDNRHYALMSHIPILEPSSPKEAYEYYKEASFLSIKFEIPIILRLTTHVCHAKEKINFKPYSKKSINSLKFNVNNGPYVPITIDSINLKRNNLRKIDNIKKHVSSFNKLINNSNKNFGIITAGLPYLSLQDNLVNVLDKPDILKIGCIYPLEVNQIKAFINSHKEIKIIEELDDILENKIKSIAFDIKATSKIIGKIDLEDMIGEYSPDRTKEILRKTWPNILSLDQNINKNDAIISSLPTRRPQMCPGCGHRSAFYAIKQALGSDDITVADIGCHTLGYLPPYRMGQLLMCMGSSIGISSGLSLFNSRRKVVLFMGDSTFFHAALPGIVNSIFNKHNITMILMDNGTTAMTGHQENPSTGRNFDYSTQDISMELVLKSLGVKNISISDAYQQNKLVQIIKNSIALNEFSVVIAKHPCMLKFMRKQKKRSDYKQKQVVIDSNKCTKSYTCIEKFNCPSFERNQDGSIKINTDLCIGDGSCIQVCPSEAISISNI